MVNLWRVWQPVGLQAPTLVGFPLSPPEQIVPNPCLIFHFWKVVKLCVPSRPLACPT